MAALVRLVGPWNGRPLETEVTLPSDPSLLGRRLVFQAAFHDPESSTPLSLRRTNALALVIGTRPRIEELPGER